MPTDKSFENDQIKLDFIDGVMYAHYKPGIRLTLKDAHFLTNLRDEFCEGREYPFIIYDGGVVSMDKEARNYFSSAEGTRGIMIAAFIETSVFSKFLINFFLTISKPRVKSKAFNNVEDAKIWIEKNL